MAFFAVNQKDGSPSLTARNCQSSTEITNSTGDNREPSINSETYRTELHSSTSPAYKTIK